MTVDRAILLQIVMVTIFSVTQLVQQSHTEHNSINCSSNSTELNQLSSN